MCALSTIRDRIQSTLFSWIIEILRPLTVTRQKLVTVLEIVRIEDFVPQPRRGRDGHPSEDHHAIARALDAKAVLNADTSIPLTSEVH